MVVLPVLGPTTGFAKQNNPPSAPILGVFKDSNKPIHLNEQNRTPGSPISSSPPSQPSSKADFAVPSSSAACSSSPTRTVASGRHYARSRLSSMVPPSSPPPLPTSPVPAARSAVATTAAKECTSTTAQIVHLHDQDYLCIRRGQTMQFGRKLRTMQKATPPDETETTTYVVLPKAAKHASRRHCTVAFHGDSFSISALGQNGVLLDGQTLSNGETKILSLSSCAGSFILGFYSEIHVTIREEADSSAGDRDQAISARGDLANPTSEATQMLDLPSSPLSEAAPSRRTSPEPRPVKRVKRDSGPARLSRASSEAVPSSDPYAHQEDNGYPPESEDESEDADEDDASRIAKLAQDVRLREAFSRIRSAIKDGTIDLVGALCSSLVFQTRRATLTTSECVSVLLEDQPSLLSYGDEACWRAAVLSCLRSGPFGMIDNTEGLKDAAGKRVETSWHYSPQMDGDEGRRSSLQPFVKTVRQAQRARKQYYYKRPSDLRKVRRA